MKTKSYLLALLLTAVPASFISCNDDDDNHGSFVTETVLNAFQNLYPQVQPYDWEIEGPYVKAEFYKDQAHAEAWFTPQGEWVRTETDFTGVLPAPIVTYIETNHAGYTVEEVDFVETPTATYYEVELDKHGAPDLKLLITAEGTIVNDTTSPEAVFTQAMTTFSALYPDTPVNKWEKEGPYLKAEFIKDGTPAEAYFNADGEWVRTETDFRGTLPEAVMNYLNANYATHVIDEVDWVETPTQNYYEIELEQNGTPDLKVHITPEGVVVA